jgi:hypothetical protein
MFPKNFDERADGKSGPAENLPRPDSFEELPREG